MTKPAQPHFLMKHVYVPTEKSADDVNIYT